MADEETREIVSCNGLSCGRGLHNECAQFNRSNNCCCPTGESDSEPRTSGQSLHERARRALESPASTSSGPPKNDGNLRDPYSTGRKRAAILFPLNQNEACEWKGFADCGGNNYPIVGCFDGKQFTRHHGPDKHTINNDQNNVHRICARCHNLWHYWNDETYSETGPFAEHNPRVATDAELKEWNDPKTRPKPPYPRKGAFKAKELEDD